MSTGPTPARPHRPAPGPTGPTGPTGAADVARRAGDGNGNGSAHALLEALHVSKEFGGLVAVSDVSFFIEPHSIVSIIGPNGAGKTTFFNMLTGLYKPTSGEITFDGRSITRRRPDMITTHGRRADLPEHPPVRRDDAHSRT